jgi:hypothetical protein
MNFLVAPIGCSVGKNGVNRHGDTKRIQILINQHYLEKPKYQAEIDAAIGGLLVEDGICGINTQTAIRSFQMVVMQKSAAWSDGRVDPGGQTWKALSGNTEVDNIVPVYFSDQIKAVVADTLATSGPYRPFNQGKYSGTHLGHSTRYDSNKDGKITEDDKFSTISRHGCLMCTLTMAATAIGNRTRHWPKTLAPQDLTPLTANKILKESGAFGSNHTLWVPTACSALGMDHVQYGYDTTIPHNALDLIRGHIATGNPIAAHVDYYGDDGGDHWVLITKAISGGLLEFEGIDPSGGNVMYFHSISALSDRYHYHTAGSRPGVLFGVGGPQSNPKRRAKQMNYIVQRFVLLSPSRTVQ